MNTFSSNTFHSAIRLTCLSLLLVLASTLTQSLSAQTLPYHGTATSSSTLWWITQLGLGPAGEFDISNSSNTSPALLATTNGSGLAPQATAGSGLASNFSAKVKMTGFQLSSRSTTIHRRNQHHAGSANGFTYFCGSARSYSF